MLESVGRSRKTVSPLRKNFYRVWYNPYMLEPDEEDCMEVTAETEDEARRRVSSKGYVTDVEEIESLTDPYDECLTESDIEPDIKLTSREDAYVSELAGLVKYGTSVIALEDEIYSDCSDHPEIALKLIKALHAKLKNYEQSDYDECLDEANVVGMGGGYPNVYLPKAAKEYLRRKGFQEVDTEIGPCFYMRFPGNEVWEIYIDEQYGGIYVVQQGYDLKPTDNITTIDDYDYKDDIDAVINLGNCLSNGEDFDSCLKAFFT